MGVSFSTANRIVHNFRMRAALSLPWAVPETQRQKYTYRDMFSRHLKSLMGARGVGIKTIARKAGIHESTIRDYLIGKCMPEVKYMQKLAGALGVSLESMYPPPTEKQKPPRRNGDGFKKIERFDCHHSTALA
jgi:ribosome-binding protein aMBF1 (putative translation factor)